MTEPIQLMLVDDHEVVRTGLKAFLDAQEGFEVIAEAGDGAAAIALALRARPDVIIMDINMPNMDGLEAIRELQSLWPGCKALALTVHSDREYFFSAMAAGAMGYVTKASAADELVEAIRCAARGEVYLQPELNRWLLEDYRRLLELQERRTQSEEITRPEPSLSILSDRELQVLEALASGLSNTEIGVKLGISPKTVARHRERMMARLNLHSATELVKFAIRTGVIRVA